jgi:hypothetical protein
VGKVWYQVRVRECIEPPRNTNGRFIPGKWVKKSKFFFARNSGEAAKKYKGNGHVMYAKKVSKDQLLGVGDFFRLGDQFLRELKEERRYDGRQGEETPYQY